VLSHSCELDKPQNQRGQVAPVMPLEGLSPEHQSEIVRGANYAHMYLPDVPTLGDCYVDLRVLSTVDTRSLRTRSKVASMTDEARLRLHVHVFAFFTRRQIPASSEVPQRR
jgi:hypothetical protein